MKIDATELKKWPEIWQKLPVALTNLGSDYFYFHYLEDQTNGFIKIMGGGRSSSIGRSIFKGISSSHTNLALTAGFVRFPLESSSLLTYLLLRSYVGAEEYAKCEETKDFSSFAESVKVVDEAFIKWDAIDLEEAKKASVAGRQTEFGIDAREDFELAISEFIPFDDYSTTMAVCDAVDSLSVGMIGRSLYGGLVRRWVLGVPSPLGGLFDDKNGTMRYSIGGILAKEPKMLAKRQEAVAMMRRGLSARQIFRLTGWYMGSEDGKWRFRINDADSHFKAEAFGRIEIGASKSGFGYIPLGYSFEDIDAIVNSMTSSGQSVGALVKKKYAENISKGEPADKAGLFGVKLSDVFHHSRLYSCYPSVAELPVVMLIDGSYPDGLLEQGSGGPFYYAESPVPHIVFHGSFSTSDKTVLLHEIQHAIQDIEGFAQGGNTSLSRLIVFLGGKNVKRYVNGHKAYRKLWDIALSNPSFKERIESEEHLAGYKKSLYDKLLRLASAVNEKAKSGVELIAEKMSSRFEAAITEGISFESIQDLIHTTAVQLGGSGLPAHASFVEFACQGLIGRFLLASSGDEAANKKWLELAEWMLILINAQLEQKEATKDFLVQGYSATDLSRFFYAYYRGLLGEVESRSVQSEHFVSNELAEAFVPHSAEAILKETITVINDTEVENNGAVPLSAIETYKPADNGEPDSLGAYCLHTCHSVSQVDVLHEIGHVMYDTVAHNPALTKAIEDIYSKSSEGAGQGNLEEWFVANGFLGAVSHFYCKATNDKNMKSVIDKRYGLGEEPTEISRFVFELLISSVPNNELITMDKCEKFVNLLSTYVSLGYNS